MAWNEKYGEAHNEKRRNRYKNDPQYRAEQVARAAEQRAKNRDEDGNLLKEYNGEMVSVFKISDIANHCGVTVTRVRSAFNRGRVPPSSFEGRHIYVTQHQMDLVKRAFDNAEVADGDMRAELDKEW